MAWVWTNPRTWTDGEIVTALIQNTHIRDNEEYLYYTNRVIPKTANEGVLNSAVLQNDDHLLYALAASEVWAFEIVLEIIQGASALPNFKYAITVPALATLAYGGTYEIPAAASATDQATAVAGTAMPVDVDDSEVKIIVIHAIVVNGANAGNMQLQWAQNAATAGITTTVTTGSYLVGRRLA